jgi:hypothetical protein
VSLRVVPMTVKEAKRRVKQWHRKLEDIQGGLFCAGVEVDGELRGVAVAGNPSRVWQGQAKLVISRVATDGVKNGCSRLYAALSRAAEELGYREVWTYTVPGESGASPKGAGFEYMGLSDANANHSRPSRKRRPPKVTGPKHRWRKALRPDWKADERNVAAPRSAVSKYEVADDAAEKLRGSLATREEE